VIDQVFKLGSTAVRMAPLLWERYQRELRRGIIAAPFRPRPELWDDTGLHAAWLGHTTVLLKIEGTTLLTDPVFSERAGVDLGIATLGPKRLVHAALRANEVPGADILVLSHAHMDHFDLPSLRALESKKTSVVTASRTSDLLRAGKWKAVHELIWGAEVRIGDISIRAVEVNHWGARVQTDTFRGYNGYLIESPKYRVLFGGDTAITSVFRQLHTARGVDLAIMPIGAYNPWIRAHCTPEQALSMAEAAGSEFILGVHHQTFELSQEPNLEPIHRLQGALNGADGRLALSSIGEEFHLNR
jgi:L-ascorbate metabolism protein UlaG (beta-lactamase superfamily)